jgi:DNA helicase II / ATP-dependent DNA helicase PcrA
MELIRESARNLRADVLSTLNHKSEKVSLDDLINATASHLGVELLPAMSGAAILRGATATQFGSTIAYDTSLSDGYREYCILHEIGHFVLHGGADRKECSSSDFEVPIGYAESDRDIGFGYGPKMLKEREANLFALEFILPTDILGKSFLDGDTSRFESHFDAIKKQTGQSDSFIISQLSQAILLNTEKKAAAPPSRPGPSLESNSSQKRAAEIEKGPLLLVAGPGTGKTKTLIERIIFLLKGGADPSSILALTFSTKATEEIQKRIEAFSPEAALKISVYNFHGFALELLRKYWKEAGLDQNPNIIGRLDAILHLEKHYESFEFDLLENFKDPTNTLVNALNYISKLQDELISPSDLENILAAEEMKLSETEETDGVSEQSIEWRVAIMKQREALRVYQKYFEFLNETKSLDFGEMIFRCVRLLWEHPKVLKDVQTRFQNILVDEFQDVNRASGVFLKLISGDGSGLWAVGDIRQSIYRWRGASPENVQRFNEEYKGAKTLQLDVNYRSGEKIVKLFSRFASHMQVGQFHEQISLESASPEAAEVRYKTFSSKSAEAISIAEAIAKNIEDGERFSDHAIVARSRNSLQKISKVLEEQRIPVLFLGAVFEREEVRDLLCLLDIRSSAEGNGLLRASKNQKFSIPEEDVARILKEVNSEENDFQSFIESEAIPEDLSDEGQRGLKKLRDFLSRHPRNLSAHEYLGRVLFKEGMVLGDILRNYDPIRTPQELLAIYQLLSLTRTVEQSFKEQGEHQIEKFLHHLRLLIALDEHHDISRIPDALSHYDAVRILTVHGSKGLEFDNVFVPGLNKSSFPQSARTTPGEIPLPTVLREKTSNYQQDEEECLFFVAISRPKRRLTLSRNEKGEKGKSTTESPFLENIKDMLIVENHAIGLEPEQTAVSGKGFEKTSMHFGWIKDYQTCPRKFFYKRVMEADGKTLVSPYQRYNRAIRESFDEIKRTSKPEELKSTDKALAILDKFLDKFEIDSNPNSKAYKLQARKIVKSFCSLVSKEVGEFYTGSLTCQLDNGQVYFYPDLMIVNQDSARIFQIEYKDTPKKKPTYSDIGDTLFLMADAVTSKLGISSIQTFTLYLPSGGSYEFDPTAKLISNRRVKTEKTIASIREGYFEATPSPKKCNTCKYVFPCPS